MGTRFDQLVKAHEALDAAKDRTRAAREALDAAAKARDQAVVELSEAIGESAADPAQREELQRYREWARARRSAEKE